MIRECLELYDKIAGEYPEDLSLDELHEVTGQYAKVKQYRDTINEYPQKIRTLCEFILASKGSKEDTAKFLSYISAHPEAFYVEKKETFLEKRRRITGRAKEVGIKDTVLFNLVGIAEIKDLLQKMGNLPDEYAPLVKKYLELY